GTAPDDHPVAVDQIGHGADDEGRAPELLDLALELPHLPFVPYLLGLDVPLVRLYLAKLFAEFQVPGLQRIDAVKQEPALLVRTLRLLWLPGAFCHRSLTYL